jgi:hypothetical protein
VEIKCYCGYGSNLDIIGQQRIQAMPKFAQRYRIMGFEICDLLAGVYSGIGPARCGDVNFFLQDITQYLLYDSLNSIIGTGLSLPAQIISAVVLKGEPYIAHGENMVTVLFICYK